MGKKIQMTTPQTIENELLAKAKKNLLGRTISSVRFMTEKEMDDNSWDNRAVVLQLDDGHIIYPMTDSEANNAGVLGTSYGGMERISKL